ncbi:hypothetical protein DFJ73DRAFT_961784 [Zopfochytrium polystomum]|nr:hypothetical protein DFJ73DRAFT_961784 [Zopfochytrium polystomum]
MGGFHKVDQQAEAFSDHGQLKRLFGRMQLCWIQFQIVFIITFAPVMTATPARFLRHSNGIVGTARCESWCNRAGGESRSLSARFRRPSSSFSKRSFTLSEASSFSCRTLRDATSCAHRFSPASWRLRSIELHLQSVALRFQVRAPAAQRLELLSGIVVIVGGGGGVGAWLLRRPRQPAECDRIRQRQGGVLLDAARRLLRTPRGPGLACKPFQIVFAKVLYASVEREADLLEHVSIQLCRIQLQSAVNIQGVPAALARLLRYSNGANVRTPQISSHFENGVFQAAVPRSDGQNRELLAEVGDTVGGQSASKDSFDTGTTEPAQCQQATYRGGAVRVLNHRSGKLVGLFPFRFRRARFLEIIQHQPEPAPRFREAQLSARDCSSSAQEGRRAPAPETRTCPTKRLVGLELWSIKTGRVSSQGVKRRSVRSLKANVNVLSGLQEQGLPVLMMRG